jgi:hypothetical protein
MLLAITLEPVIANPKSGIRYIPLDLVSGLRPDLDLTINERSLRLDLSKTQNIRVRLKVNDLYRSVNRISSFNIVVYEVIGSDRKFVSSQNLTIRRDSRPNRVVALDAGYFASPTKNIEIEVFDTAGDLINTYRAFLEAVKLDSQIVSSDLASLHGSDCDDSFDDCHIDYLFKKITFEAKPQVQPSTRIIKGEDGLYKVTIPVPRTKFRFLGKRVRRRAGGGTGGGGGTDGGGTSSGFGEKIDISVINIGNNFAESQSITYGASGELNFNDNFFLDLEGKVGIGVNPPQAWLQIRQGDSNTPSLILNPGILTTPPKDGALEYDGNNLYFTVGSTRSVVGSGLAPGTILNTVTNFVNVTHLYDNSFITYDNGTVINFTNGSYIEDAMLNGNIFFTDNSVLQLNGSLIIPGGVNGQVLTYVNGEALWRDTSAVANGGTSYFTDVTNVYNNGNILFNQSTLTYEDTVQNFYESESNYYNHRDEYDNSFITYDNGTVINFTNGSYIEDAMLNGNIFFTDNSVLQLNGSLIIPGGVNGQVLTYVNGEALWRDTSAVANGGTSYFTDVTNVYNNGNILFNQSTLTYEDTVQNFYESESNYYNHRDEYDNSFITYDNGTVINFTNGSYIEDAMLNGNIFFTDNSVLQLNGSLIIPGGVNGQVLTYVNGEALWRDTSAVANGGTSYFTDVTNVYNNGNILFNQSTLTYEDTVQNFYESESNYYNHRDEYDNSFITYDNGTVINFTNGSYIEDAMLNGNIFFTDNSVLQLNGSLIIPGGVNGQVLTYVNGEALWRDTSAVANGGTSYFTDVTNVYNNGNILFNQSTLTYEDTVQNFYESESNYYNHRDEYDNSFITYDNGTVINFTNGSYIEDAMLNGNIFFTDNSVLQLNGSLIIPGGVNGQVLTYVNGEALWRDTSAVANGGTSYFTDVTNVYNNGNILFNQSTLTYENTVQNFYESESNYYNHRDEYDNSFITYDNGTVINFTNGSYIEDAMLNGNIFFTDNSVLQLNGSLIIPGGVNGQVLTYVNGEALWRDTSAVANGGTSYFTDVTNVYNNGNILFNQSTLTYEDTVQNFYESESNYYNHRDEYDNSFITYDNGTVINFTNGSYIEDAMLNGNIFFTDNSVLQLNGSLIIPGGVNGQVLTYVNGEALWRDTSAVANGGTSYFTDVTNVYNNGNILFNQSTLTYENTVQNFYESESNYYNHRDEYDNSFITYDNGTVINFTNGSYIEDAMLNGNIFFTDNSVLQLNGSLIIPGGVNGQVLTYVNGEALWRDTSAVANGGTSYFTDVTNVYNNGNILFNQSTLTYENTVQNFYESESNYYNHRDEYDNSFITYDNGTVINFTNGSYIEDAMLNGNIFFTDNSVLQLNGSLIIPGGVNGQVLTYVNGEALWRDTSAVANGGTSYFTDVTNVYNNGNILFNQSTLTYEDTVQNFYESESNYYNHRDEYDNSFITYDNGTVINFTNGSYIEDAMLNGNIFFTDNSVLQLNGSLIIPGGVNGQVLTYVNGEALWRDTSAVANGGTSYFTDVTNVYNNGNILFNQSTLTYEDTVQNFYESESNYYNHRDEYDNSFITYDNGTVINFTNGSYIEDAMLNGNIFFTDNSVLQLNGSLIIPGGVNGQVLTYVNGEALWRDTSAVANGGTSNFIDVTHIYNNGEVNFIDSLIVVDNTDLLFVNGSSITGAMLTDVELLGSLSIPGGVNGQVLTYVNGEALWRDTSAVANGGTSYFTDVTNVYNNGNILFNQSTLTYEDTVQNFYESESNYYNHRDEYDNSFITYDNGTVIDFTNGSYIEDAMLNGNIFFTDNSVLQLNGSLIIPGGVNGQVLTYVNGEALWRDTSAVANGGTSYFTDVTNVYNNGNILFNQSTLTYEDTVQNFYDSVSNYYNHTDLYDNSFITYDNGTVINFTHGSYIEDLMLNGYVLFSDSSTVQINGSLIIPGGAVNGYVLTTNANGVASWEAPSSSNWVDIGAALHPVESPDTKSIIIGGTSIATADIELMSDGGAVFNKQGTGSDFVINNAAAGAFVVSGATGATSIATSGLVGAATLELSDSVADVTFSMLPNGSASGPMFVASATGLAVISDQSITINAGGNNAEIVIEDQKVSIGNYNGDATLNVNGSLALVGKATQSLAAADSINADSSYVRVVGDGGPVILTSNPQITATSVQDGQILVIRGIDSVNTVTLVEGNGLSLTDGLNFVLGEKDTIQFIYDAFEDEWIELHRSDKL